MDANNQTRVGLTEGGVGWGGGGLPGVNLGVNPMKARVSGLFTGYPEAQLIINKI